MEHQLTFPHLKAIPTGKGQLRYRYFLVPNDPVEGNVQPGKFLAEFIGLDMSGFCRELDEIIEVLRSDTDL